MRGYSRDRGVVGLPVRIPSFPRNTTGQLGGELQRCVGCLDGHVVGDPPPSGRRSANPLSLPSAEKRRSPFVSVPFFLASFVPTPYSWRSFLPSRIKKKRQDLSRNFCVANLNDLCWFNLKQTGFVYVYVYVYTLGRRFVRDC